MFSVSFVSDTTETEKLKTVWTCESYKIRTDENGYPSIEFIMLNKVRCYFINGNPINVCFIENQSGKIIDKILAEKGFIFRNDS
jgi:hypothetical protein